MAINLEFVILLLNEFPGTMEVERKVGNAGNFVLTLIIVVILFNQFDQGDRSLISYFD